MNTVTASNGIEIPFPVETPFAMRPNMRPWQEGERIVIRDRQFEDYIKEKKQYYGPAYGDNPQIDLLKRAVTNLQKYDPSFVFDINEDGPVYNLTMSLQEDWVLFSPNRQGQLSAQILSVHLPSGWDPREKAGMTFSEIHEPVADNTLIMKAADHISNVICTKGPFIRHVWAISNTGKLSRRPDLITERRDNDINQMWYRCERQTTIPVDGEAALFLIRVYVAPLAEVFQDREKKKAIIDSINSMSDAVIAYKGYERLRNYLNQHDV
jgi:hypothetical protein